MNWMVLTLIRYNNLLVFSAIFQIRRNYQNRQYYRSDRNTRWKASKIRAPPPTAQTPGPNWLIFWRETPHVNTFRGTEAIFEFHPRSGDTSRFLLDFGPRLDPSKAHKWAHISALRTKFKNRLGAPKSIHMMVLSPKNEPIRPGRLGCRGAIEF